MTYPFWVAGRWLANCGRWAVHYFRLWASLNSDYKIYSGKTKSFKIHFAHQKMYSRSILWHDPRSFSAPWFSLDSTNRSEDSLRKRKQKSLRKINWIHFLQAHSSLEKVYSLTLSPWLPRQRDHLQISRNVDKIHLSLLCHIIKEKYGFLHLRNFIEVPS